MDKRLTIQFAWACIMSPKGIKVTHKVISMNCRVRVVNMAWMLICWFGCQRALPRRQLSIEDGGAEFLHYRSCIITRRGCNSAALQQMHCNQCAACHVN